MIDTKTHKLYITIMTSCTNASAYVRTFNLSPVVCATDERSLPARSMRLILLTLLISSPSSALLWVRMIVTTECDRLLLSFIPVAAVALYLFPTDNQYWTSMCIQTHSRYTYIGSYLHMYVHTQKSTYNTYVRTMSYVCTFIHTMHTVHMSSWTWVAIQGQTKQVQLSVMLSDCTHMAGREKWVLSIYVHSSMYYPRYLTNQVWLYVFA